MSGSSPWVVMFSGSPWDAAAHRQQALARQLAAAYRVVFVDPPGHRPTRFDKRLVAPNLWQVTPVVWAPGGRQLSALNRINRKATGRALRRWIPAADSVVLWLDDDLASSVADGWPHQAVVYDVTDLDWTFARSWSRRHLQRGLQSCVARADLVIASSPALPERLPPHSADQAVIPNGCDPELFVPAEVRRSDVDGPVLGYLGAIDERAFDGALVAEVARRRPEWSFLLVGPATRNGAAAVRGLPNVHLRRAVKFAEAPSLMASMDVGLIPYRVGGVIDYVQPKKLYEYLAVGLPVVATPLPALRGLPHVRLATNAEEFVAAVEAALQESADVDLRESRREVALANSWADRGALVRGLVAELAS